MTKRQTTYGLIHNSGMPRRPTPRELLASNLKAAMERAGLSGNALAKRAGISQTHLAKVLRCEAAFSTDILAEVAQGLGCESWELLVDSDAVREEAVRRILAPEGHAPKKLEAGKNPPLRVRSK